MIRKDQRHQNPQSIEQCNVVLLVLDAQQGVMKQDATLAGHILESGRALVVVVNKWDGLESHQRERVKAELSQLSFLDFAEHPCISARHGSGGQSLHSDRYGAYANAQRKLPPELTRVLEQAVQEHQPPRYVHGRRIKLRYAHQGRWIPIVVIPGNQAEAACDLSTLSDQSLPRGVQPARNTIRMEFKSGDNPSMGADLLTERQLHQAPAAQSFVNRKS